MTGADGIHGGGLGNRHARHRVGANPRDSPFHHLSTPPAGLPGARVAAPVPATLDHMFFGTDFHGR